MYNIYITTRGREAGRTQTINPLSAPLLLARTGAHRWFLPLFGTAALPAGSSSSIAAAAALPQGSGIAQPPEQAPAGASRAQFAAPGGGCGGQGGDGWQGPGLRNRGAAAPPRGRCPACSAAPAEPLPCSGRSQRSGSGHLLLRRDQHGCFQLLSQPALPRSCLVAAAGGTEKIKPAFCTARMQELALLLRAE